MRTLKRTALVLLTTAILAMVFLVTGSAQTDVKYTDAAQYYKDAKCTVCHGQKAEKKFNLEDKDEDLTQIILKGKKPEKPPNMPGYEAKGLTAEQAKALVDYMRELRKQ
jgi:mono/diheme cytochrome c family protein